jgi:hypothetical protein
MIRERYYYAFAIWWPMYSLISADLQTETEIQGAQLATKIL